MASNTFFSVRAVISTLTAFCEFGIRFGTVEGLLFAVEGILHAGISAVFLGRFARPRGGRETLLDLSTDLFFFLRQRITWKVLMNRRYLTLNLGILVTFSQHPFLPEHVSASLAFLFGHADRQQTMHEQLFQATKTMT
jgi:hypothetical protein